MENLNKNWIGSIFGTNTGNLYIEFEHSGENVSGSWHVNDTNFGLVVYKISGKYGNCLKVSGKTDDTINNKVTISEIEIEAVLNPQGQLQGTWKTSIGAAGTFFASPFAPNMEFSSEKIYIENITLGPVSLFLDDLKQLFQEIKKEFTTGQLFVIYKNSSGTRVFGSAENFLKEIDHLNILNELTIYIEEPRKEDSIKKQVRVELGVLDNRISVQGVPESWAVGKGKILTSILKTHQNPWKTKYKRFGLGLNTLVFAIMLAVIPSISTWEERVVAIFLVFSVLVLHLWLRTRLVPMTKIKLKDEKANWFVRRWPSILSWLGTLLASLIVLAVSYYLKIN